MTKLGIVFKLFTLLLFAQAGNATFLQTDIELAEKYIENHSEIAMAEMIRTGVPASIKLAQGMLESDWGRSDLAKKANNHFGIKCGSNWKGGTFFKSDDDVDRDGNLIESCFRSFDNTHESFIAHSDFLTDPKKSYRYGFLFDFETTDYKKWAKGLQKAGYATDKKYPKKLIRIIEKYGLDKFDIQNGDHVSATNKVVRKVVLDSESNDTNSSSSAVEHHSAEDLRKGKVNSLMVLYGDGIASIKDIAEAHRRKAIQLLKFNELFPDENYVPKKDMVVFLQRKKTRTSNKQTHHIVYEGETMASIAHQYGLKLKSLYSKNRMPKGAEPVVGEKLNLYRQVGSSNRPKFINLFENNNENGDLLFLDDPDLK